MKNLTRKAAGILFAAVVAYPGIGVAHSQPAGSANFALSSNPAAPVEQSPEQRLLDIRTSTFLVSGYVIDDEAREYAESLVARAVAGELTYTYNAYSSYGEYMESQDGVSGRLWRIPRDVIEAWISKEEQNYLTAVQMGSNSTSADRVGVATGADADYIYYVEAVAR